MNADLEIRITTEALEGCAPEEGAGYGLLSILAAGSYISEGIDHHIRSYRPGPLVSGYHLAEWLAWHWWRQRWEPRRGGFEWAQAHCMSSVGAGYVWPNITIASDGLRTTLSAVPSSRPDAKPFRYTSSAGNAFPATVWENAVDAFISQITARLDAQGIKGTNLHKLADDLLAERSDPELTHYRRVEALLGKGPDALDESLVKQLVGEAETLGVGALDEMAAQADLNALEAPVSLSAAGLADIARRDGFPASFQNCIDLKSDTLAAPTTQLRPAWEWGEALAQQIRQQESLADQPIEDQLLADMAGVSAHHLRAGKSKARYLRAHAHRQGASASTSIGRQAATAQPAFLLAGLPRGDRVVLRAKGRSGRRFEMARLLADHLLAPADRLHPATRTYTYRQKAQRAFAAELLCPADTIIAELNGEYEDEERREDLASHFHVSPMVIQTQLVNHSLLPRADLRPGPLSQS